MNPLDHPLIQTCVAGHLLRIIQESDEEELKIYFADLQKNGDAGFSLWIEAKEDHLLVKPVTQEQMIAMHEAALNKEREGATH